jgi:hypothetical protein
MQLAIGNERIIPQASKSPDTYLMEHILSAVKRELKRRREIFRNAEQLGVTIREIWDQLANDREFFYNFS